MPRQSSDEERKEREHRGAQLRLARKSAGFKGLRSLAEKYPTWNMNTYKAHESGRNGFGPAAAKKYALAFGVKPSFFDEENVLGVSELEYVSDDDEEPDGEPTEPFESSVGVLSADLPKGFVLEARADAQLGAGGISHVMEGVALLHGNTYAAEGVRDWWRLPDWVFYSLGLSPSRVRCFATKGDSMLPTLDEGDIVFLDVTHKVPSPPGLYAIADEFGGLVVKRLEVVSPLREEPIRVLVSSDNAERHPPREVTLNEIAIVGRYVAMFTFRNRR